MTSSNEQCFGVYLDPIVRRLANFLFNHMNKANVEIEGKIGLMLDPTTHSKYVMHGVHPQQPVMVDSKCIQYVFHSAIDNNMFTHLSRHVLEARFSKDQRSGTPLFTKRETKTEDRFYALPGSSRCIRVSIDGDTLQETARIIKDKVEQFEIHFPTACDVRFTASTEVDASHMDIKELTCKMIRRKQRTSYVYGIYAMDCTRVESWGMYKIKDLVPQGIPQVTYEVEVEILDYVYVRAEHAKVTRGEANQFTNIAAGLYDKIRHLSEYAFPRKDAHGQFIVPALCK